MGGAGCAHLEEHKFSLCLVVERRLGPENHVPRLTKPAAAAAADQHACCRISALKLQQADDREREKPDNLLFFKWTSEAPNEHGLVTMIHACLLHLNLQNYIEPGKRHRGCFQPIAKRHLCCCAASN